jgi:hypothetical protein
MKRLYTETTTSTAPAGGTVCGNVVHRWSLTRHRMRGAVFDKNAGHFSQNSRIWGYLTGLLTSPFFSSDDCWDNITESQDWLMSRIGFRPNLPVARTMSPWGDYKYCYIFGKSNVKAGVARAVSGGNCCAVNSSPAHCPMGDIP